jgi:hypothetical protein
VLDHPALDGWNEAKSVGFTVQASSGFTTYTIPMGSNAGCTGTIKQIRLDPIAAVGTVGLDFVQINP